MILLSIEWIPDMCYIIIIKSQFRQLPTSATFTLVGSHTDLASTLFILINAPGALHFSKQGAFIRDQILQHQIRINLIL